MKTIKAKAGFACAAVFVIAATLAGVGGWSVYELSDQLQSTHRSAMLVRRHMHADMAHDAIREAILGALLASDPAVGGDAAEAKKDVEEQAEGFLEDVRQSKPLTHDPKVQATLAALDAPIRDYIAAGRALAGKAAAGDRAGALALFPAFEVKFKFLEKAMEEASDRIEAADSADSAAGARLATLSGILMASALALAIAAAVIITIMSRRLLVRPLEGLADAMLRLADGDTGSAIDGAARPDEIGAMARAAETFRAAAIAKADLEADADRQRQTAEAERRAAEAAVLDQERALVAGSFGRGLEALAAGNLRFRLTDDIPEEYGRLRDDFNSAIGNLEQALGAIRANSDSISTGADEIAQASESLSKRTEQQAASLEETAAALDQITAVVTKTATGAGQARDTASAASAEAARSDEVVSGAVRAMDQIAQSSQQISQIIGVIDEIAFQTNLLALNAGVEAARAGDAGRGFAVVASEVRALAQRSAEAAKEIKALISASTQQVSEGVDLVGRAGEALRLIAGKVGEVDSLVGEIAAAAQEQSTGLAEVNTAVNQMDQVVQQNAAMVEESAAATATLKNETGKLIDLVERFQVTAANAEDSAWRAQPPTRRALRVAGGGGSDSWEEF